MGKLVLNDNDVSVYLNIISLAVMYVDSCQGRIRLRKEVDSSFALV
jgi:hypothetical protein